MPNMKSPSQSPAVKSSSPSGGVGGQHLGYSSAYGGVASPSYNMTVNRPGASGMGARPGAAAYDPAADVRNSDSSESDEERKDKET